jgi:hypothetical protein
LSIATIVLSAVVTSVVAYRLLPARSSPSAAISNFGITSATQSVALCAPITGTGTIPHGWDLWIGARASDNDYFWLGKARSISSNAWETNPIKLGTAEAPNNSAYQVVAVLLDTETSQYVTDQLQRRTAFGPMLPPHAIRVVDTTIIRRADNKGDC